MEQKEVPLVAEFGGTYTEPGTTSSLTNPSALEPDIGAGEGGEGGGGEDMASEMNPTEDEMERERLQAKAEQLQDEIDKLRAELHSKETEMAEVKKALGITPFVEFKQSLSHGLEVIGNKLKGIQETEGYHKVDDKLTSWKTRVEESSAYQKTVSTLSDGSKKATGAISSAGTRIKENEKVKAIGEKTSSAFKRTGTAIKEKASNLREKMKPSADHGDGEVPVPDVSSVTNDYQSAEYSDREN